jgi:hypothetical protein
MTAALEKAKQRRAELDAKIKRDEMRIEARKLAKEVGACLTKRDYLGAVQQAEALHHVCVAITDSIIAVAESAEDAE